MWKRDILNVYNEDVNELVLLKKDFVVVVVVVVDVSALLS